MNTGLDMYGLVQGELWKHSFAAAIAAEEMNNLTAEELPNESFTAALLHDIGKLALSQVMDEEKLEEIIRLSKSEKYSYYDAEQEVLGISHTKVGWMLAKDWNFSEKIAQAILYHHEPEKNPDIIIDVVHVANLVTKILAIGLDFGELRVWGSGKSAKRIGLSRQDFENLVAIVQQRMETIEDFIN
jgi:putative nucleotidyltransferase with HDIG domain